MIVALIFLILAMLIGVPCAVIALVLSIGALKNKYPLITIACIVTFGLAIGTFVLASIGEYECAWVSFGLGVGCVSLGALVLIISLCLYLYKFQSSSSEKTSGYQKPASKPLNNSHDYSYIEEIKALKELLDCGALTEEEFTAKKKEVLERR